jgi:hypothetical protein
MSIQRKWKLSSGYVSVTHKDGWEEFVFVITKQHKGIAIPMVYVPFSRINPPKNAGNDWQEEAEQIARAVIKTLNSGGR